MSQEIRFPQPLETGQRHPFDENAGTRVSGGRTGVKSETDSVVILMGCYNGARFLPEQLASIAAQTHRAWRLVASDDGSSDATRTILDRFRAEHGHDRVVIREGPRRGFSANYLALAGDPEPRGTYYAFADQDDVWLPDHLARGVAWLAALPPQRPALYGTRTILIDEEGRETGRSPLFRHAPGFANALVQNIAGGNTMLFNRAAKTLLETVRDVSVIAHDWWCYLLVSGAGGTVLYDPEPSVCYRQHARNAIGGNMGLGPKLKRLHMLATGRLAHYNDVNLAALEAAAPVLTEEARLKADLLRRGRRLPLHRRIGSMRRLGLYRQTRGGTVTLWLASAARLL
jgi:glycosyltransferase involved in cell wall biosynthesis